MLFGRDPRKKAILELAMEQVRKVLREMQDDGKDISKLKIKKYQKTHYTTCTCPQCSEAKRTKNPHKRGLLEDGYKFYMGLGGEGEERDG